MFSVPFHVTQTLMCRTSPLSAMALCLIGCTCGCSTSAPPTFQGSGGQAGGAAGEGGGPRGGTTSTGVGGGSSIILVRDDAGASGGRGGMALCGDAQDCTIGCGNARVEPTLGEICDDGNSRSGDGCSADCKVVETGYACPTPGEPCVSTVHCGDGKVGGVETCDDGNTKSGDGCGSDCRRETGWECPSPGARCLPRCGDGMVVGDEECDAPNVGRGCSATCSLEPGYVCDSRSDAAAPAPAVCHKTACADGKREGDEACDDGNTLDGDGCSALCNLEPDCAKGQCTSKCGDRIIVGGEACDDGNARDGDGCSSTCTIERGFTCTDTQSSPPAALNLLTTYRDFISFPVNGSVRHPDFQSDWEGSSVTPLLVKATLASDGKPEMDGRCSNESSASIADESLCPYGQMLTGRTQFEQWYRDTSGVNLAIKNALVLPRQTNGAYGYDSAPAGFYPIDGKGWTVPPAREEEWLSDFEVNDGEYHDFGFTTEIHYFFQYRGGESLAFSGDDDLWIFINQKMALDVGGLHPRTVATLDVDAKASALGLTKNGLYEIALFHAERHSAASNFKLTLTGFVPKSSVCHSTCGDGVVVGSEGCDLGIDGNIGAYGGCTADCKRGPYCGDGEVQKDHEECDDGVNLTTYGLHGVPGCAPGCVLGAYCGDGKVDSSFGEQCDQGTDHNTGAFGGCTPDCQLEPRCGDGVVQGEFGEGCDDGNTVSGDGCSRDCQPEAR